MISLHGKHCSVTFQTLAAGHQDGQFSTRLDWTLTESLLLKILRFFFRARRSLPAWTPVPWSCKFFVLVASAEGYRIGIYQDPGSQGAVGASAKAAGALPPLG
jgi:hypothetical protein